MAPPAAAGAQAQKPAQGPGEGPGAGATGVKGGQCPLASQSSLSPVGLFPGSKGAGPTFPLGGRLCVSHLVTAAALPLPTRAGGGWAVTLLCFRQSLGGWGAGSPPPPQKQARSPRGGQPLGQGGEADTFGGWAPVLACRSGGGRTGYEPLPGRSWGAGAMQPLTWGRVPQAATFGPWRGGKSVSPLPHNSKQFLGGGEGYGAPV